MTVLAWRIERPRSCDLQEFVRRETTFSVEPSSTRLAMHRVHLGALRSRLAMRAPKGVSSTVREAAAIGRWETDWRRKLSILSSSAARNLWLRCASFSGATEINRQESGEARLNHSPGPKSCEQSAMFGMSPGKNFYPLGAAVFAKQRFSLVGAREG